MKRGKVKRFNQSIGSGEIKPDNDSWLVKFSKKAIQGDVKQVTDGAIVEYEEFENQYTYTYEAKRVIVVTPAPSATLSPTISTKPMFPTMPKSKSPPVNLHKNTSPSKEKQHGGTFKSPYGFHKRDCSKSRKTSPEQFHHVLKEGNYDIAFEITWETLTPTAVNPCKDYSQPECKPENKNEYSSYNKRWLMIDNRLAISPFTVKSAIANGFANLLGGCYRVNTKIEGHKNFEQGQYPYGGGYKRYRVAMDGSSKPGIITKIETHENGDRTFHIKPVKEFYYDEKKLPFSMKQGDTVYVLEKPRGKYKPAIVTRLTANYFNGARLIKYHDEYRYGMNSDRKGKHFHRFYTENGSEVSGMIKAENFKILEDMKRIVYMGGKNPDNETIPLWYENLTTLKKDDFVYYEEFNDEITNIGKNFLFKALFLHEDTVPEGQGECKNINELCPRCRMFGMADKTEGEDREAIGFKGRFKSATLVSNESCVKIDQKTSNFKFIEGEKPKLTQWLDDKDKRIAYQALLPIQGPPKPNKRDVNGYFDKDTGEIKGAKVYKHGWLGSAENINDVDNTGDYSHRLRNYAQVCENGQKFTGVVGAENCSIEEIAALLILLHEPIAHHGFKIGLGKAFGMGSIESRINKIWIRKKESYNEWILIQDTKDLNKNDLLKKVELSLNGISEELNLLSDVHKKINSLQNRTSRRLNYPGKGPQYWTQFWNQSRDTNT